MNGGWDRQVAEVFPSVRGAWGGCGRKVYKIPGEFAIGGKAGQVEALLARRCFVL